MSMSGAAGAGLTHMKRQRGVIFRCCKPMESPEAANNLRLGPETCSVPCFVSVESGSSIQGFRGALAQTTQSRLLLTTRRLTWKLYFRVC